MEDEAPLPTTARLQNASEALLSAVCQGTRLSQNLPQGDDLMYYLTVDPQVRPLLEEATTKCLALAQKLMAINPANTSGPQPRIIDAVDSDDMQMLYSKVIEKTNDPMIETAEAHFNHEDGINALSEATVGAASDFTVNQHSRSFRVFQNGAVERPQATFTNVDNSKMPFVPILHSKPNSLKPLDPCFTMQSLPAANPVERVVLSNNLRSHIDTLNIKEEEIENGLPNPYEYEIDHFDYVPDQLVAQKEQLYKSMEETPFSWVDDLDTLLLTIQKLNAASEIAVDLEQHSLRSYQGFVCLMQLSTRTEDFIIDTIKLRSEMYRLLDTFTNPKIVKVLHGSDSDIVWLQRDFGLYIVNLFDTGQACRVLEYPKKGLKYLLKHFCDVDAQKEFQLSDWRIRPVPEAMMAYARSDTHYLLYIYDRMRNELIGKSIANNNLLCATLSRGRDLCKKRYSKQQFLATWHTIYNRANVNFNSTQMEVYKALFEWRDSVAREEDESPGFIFPSRLLLNVAELMPESPTSLLACCSSAVTPALRAHAATVAKLISDVKMGVMTQLASPVPKRAKPVDFLQGLEMPNRSDAPSPDINQDQLFQQADWLQSSPSNFSHHTSKPRRSAECDAANAGYSTASMGSQLFGGSSRTSSSSTVDRINSSFTANSLVSFKVDPNAFDIDAPTKAKKSEESKVEQDVVPCSMAEIYQLSNQNRKRNKEKKKLKEDSIKAGPPSPISFEDEDTDMDPFQGKKDGKKDGKKEDTKDFIAKIGWPADFLTDKPAENNGDNGGGKQRRTHRRTKSITQDNNVPQGSRREQSNGGREKTSRKKRHRGQNKTFPPPPRNVNGFDYNGANTSGFNPAEGVQRSSGNHTTVTVPSMGRAANRARAKGQRSHTYKSSGRTGGGSKPF